MLGVSANFQFCRNTVAFWIRTCRFKKRLISAGSNSHLEVLFDTNFRSPVMIGRGSFHPQRMFWVVGKSEHKNIYLVYLIPEFGKDFGIIIPIIPSISFLAVHSRDRYAVPLVSTSFHKIRLPCRYFFLLSVRKSRPLRTSPRSLFSSVSGKRKPVAAFHTPRSIQREQRSSQGILPSADSHRDQFSPDCFFFSFLHHRLE